MTKKLVLLTWGLLVGMAAKANIEVISPASTLTLTVGVKDKKPFYRVAKGSYEVISNSALGVRYGDIGLFNFDAVNSDKTETVNETYQMGHGKRSAYTKELLLNKYCKNTL